MFSGSRHAPTPSVRAGFFSDRAIWHFLRPCWFVLDRHTRKQRPVVYFLIRFLLGSELLFILNLGAGLAVSAEFKGKEAYAGCSVH